MASYVMKTVKKRVAVTTTLNNKNTIFVRTKTSSYEYVSSRHRDPTFEKLMDSYKNLLKIVSIQNLILSNPNSQHISISFLQSLSDKLRLNRGAAPFLKRYPHVFEIFAVESQLFCRLTSEAARLAEVENSVSDPVKAAERLVRILAMSRDGIVPLRALFKVWRELGFPDDFEDSVISRNPNLFELVDDERERNTHLVKLVREKSDFKFTLAVENWRVLECCKVDSDVDRTELRFSFKHGFPPGMRLSKTFKAKGKEWQRAPYVGPYDDVRGSSKSKMGKMGIEKRAVAIVHEFLSLTVEKMVEVEKITQFRKWFGIDLNVRDLFLDHPGMFYLSTKGKRHTVFLREAYERGCLIEPNPVYEVRRKLLDLVRLERRGVLNRDSKLMAVSRKMEDESEEEDSD